MTSSTRSGWTALSVAALMVIALSVGNAAGSAPPELPGISPERLIQSTLAAMSRNGPISGDVTAHLDLGVPRLVEADAGSAAGPITSLFGDHHLKVWRSADGVRVADLLRTAERGLFVSKTDAWMWDSETFTARHLGPFPTHTPDPARSSGGAAHLMEMMDPAELARWGLEAVSPGTSVSLGPPDRVAGRPVYVLVLRPRTAGTLVERMEVAVDAENRLPLRVALHSRHGGAAPVLVEFTSVSFDPIDPETFEFVPPPGAAVEEAGRGAVESPDEIAAPNSPRGPQGPPRVFGEAWATVVAFPLGHPGPPPPGSGEASQLVGLLPFSGPLFSVRLVERAGSSWLLFGAVPQPSLAAVERQLP
jgi:hypothetical protein